MVKVTKAFHPDLKRITFDALVWNSEYKNLERYGRLKPEGHDESELEYAVRAAFQCGLEWIKNSIDTLESRERSENDVEEIRIIRKVKR